MHRTFHIPSSLLNSVRNSFKKTDGCHRIYWNPANRDIFKENSIVSIYLPTMACRCKNLQILPEYFHSHIFERMSTKPGAIGRNVHHYTDMCICFDITRNIPEIYLDFHNCHIVYLTLCTNVFGHFKMYISTYSIKILYMIMQKQDAFSFLIMRKAF